MQRTLNAACCAVDAYRAACRQHVSPPCQALLRQLCASAQGNGRLDRVALDARSASAVHLKVRDKRALHASTALLLLTTKYFGLGTL